MSRIFSALAFVALTVPYAANAQQDGFVAPIQPTSTMLRRELLAQLCDIRQKGLVQRQADGGQLSQAHREALQADMDAAQARFTNKMRSIGMFPYVSTPQQNGRAITAD